METFSFSRDTACKTFDGICYQWQTCSIIMKRAAFTLIVLPVVIAIIAILAARLLRIDRAPV